MLTEGKATHSVFAGLDIVSMGHSLQLSEPTDELMVPPNMECATNNKVR